MKATSGNLPLNKKYNYIGGDYGCEITTCDNCGKPISRIAELEAEGKHYFIGFDCAETLLKECNYGSFYDMKQKMKV